MNSSRAFRIFRGKSQLSKFGCVGETRNVENWRLMRKLTTSVRCSSRSEQPKASTIDQDDVSKFSALAHHWWKENGEFESLCRMNELRIPLIRDALAHQEKVDGNTAQPLKGLTVLDVGSGGGFIAEPLCRLGATVIGVDASEENIRVAQSHAELDPLVTGNVKYIHGSVEDLVATEEGRFDGVVASEIVEHVFNVPVFVSCCCKLVKPGGSLFMTTINKTYASYLLAIVVAENVLNFIPKGTHEWEKFVSPEDLQHLFSQNGMVTRLIHGMVYNPITCRWSWSNNSSVSYAIHAVKQT